MKKLLLLLLLSLGFIGSAGAVSSLDDYYSSLCIAEDSTGFNWKNNNWKQTNFIPAKYIVNRVDPATVKVWQCPESKDRGDDYYSPSSQSLNTFGCYSIKRFGEDDFDRRFDCSERWSTYEKQNDETNPKVKKLESVACNEASVFTRQFAFKPNGWFHTSLFHFMLQRESTYKDSLSVSVGKCSTL